MISIKNVSFTYASPDDYADGSEEGQTKRLREGLKDMNLSFPKGSFVILCGPSGCGKTSLTRLLNGLIPHYYEGNLTGEVTVFGKSVKDTSLFDLSKMVGSVFQNPKNQFFNVDTTSEVAFGPENHGLSEEEIKARILRASDTLHIHSLLGRSIFALSGGEKQKLACASALAMEPELFVFDEPSSNLDAGAIRDLRLYLKSLKEAGKTVVIAEHRLHYIADLADLVCYMKDGEIKNRWSGEEFLGLKEEVRDDLGLRPINLDFLEALPDQKRSVENDTRESANPPGTIEIKDLRFSYPGNSEPSLNISNLTLKPGTVTAVIGKNGAGKTTFARCLSGLEKGAGGRVLKDGVALGSKGRLKNCYFVMQDVNHQLFLESVKEETLVSMTEKGSEEEQEAKAMEILEALDLSLHAEDHPMGLSGGEKQRVAVASAIASNRSLILFDEPTSGLDLFHMRQVAELLNKLAGMGKTVVVITHDPELILRSADRVIWLKKGTIDARYSLREEAGRKALLDFFRLKDDAFWKKDGDIRDQKKKNPAKSLYDWSRGFHGKFALSILLSVIGTFSGMLPFFAVAQILGDLWQGVTDFHAFLPSLSIAGFGFLGKILFCNLSTRISHKAAYRTLEEVRIRLIEKLGRVPMGTILSTPSAKFKGILVDRMEAMEVPFAHLLPELTANTLVPLLIIVYLFALDWRMAILSLLTLVIGMVIMALGMRNYAEDGAGALAAGGKMADAVVEYIGGIEVVKAFSRSAGSYEKYAEAVRGNADYYIDWMKRSQKTMCTYNAVLPSVLVTVLPGGLLLWNGGFITTEVFFTSVIFSLGLISPIMNVFSFMSAFALLGQYTSEIQNILDAPELHHKEDPVTIKNRDIALKDVRFGYDAETEILHGVNATIPAGSMTALVGPSGSGKSTLAKLLAGFWDPSGGTITMGGIDYGDIPLVTLNKQISYVSQDNYLFNESIRENIRMGKPGASDAEVEEIAKRSGCDAFICSLKDGYDTMTGQGGGLLSGGERQRIAIARAMLKDAPIIILDEATAFIDPENEAKIQRALSALTCGKTLIVIAHRLSTVVDADQILVVNKGQIEASGSHPELLEKCRLYRDLWEAHLDARDEG